MTRFDMEARPKRSSLSEVVSLIEEDLKKGISYNSKSEIFRYTVDVAKAYLARLYFWSQNWEQAIPVAKEILEAYPLVEGTEYVDMLSAQHAQKAIFFYVPMCYLTLAVIKIIMERRDI